MLQQDTLPHLVSPSNRSQKNPYTVERGHTVRGTRNRVLRTRNRFAAGEQIGTQRDLLNRLQLAGRRDQQPQHVITQNEILSPLINSGGHRLSNASLPFNPSHTLTPIKDRRKIRENDKLFESVLP